MLRACSTCQPSGRSPGSTQPTSTTCRPSTSRVAPLRLDDVVAASAVLELDDDLRGVALAQVQRHRDVVARARHHHRRKGAPPRAQLDVGGRAGHRLLGGDVDVHGRKHRADGVGGDAAVPALPVVEVRRHAERRGQRGERRRGLATRAVGGGGGSLVVGAHGCASPGVASAGPPPGGVRPTVAEMALDPPTRTAGSDHRRGPLLRSPYDPVTARVPARPPPGAGGDPARPGGGRPVPLAGGRRRPAHAGVVRRAGRALRAPRRAAARPGRRGAPGARAARLRGDRHAGLPRATALPHPPHGGAGARRPAAGRAGRHRAGAARPDGAGPHRHHDAGRLAAEQGGRPARLPALRRAAPRRASCG